jgi:hypothetical protein
VTLSTAARNAAVDAIAALANGGSLQIATDGTFATILVTFTLPDPFLGAAANGTKSLAAALSANATASGNAEAFRIRDSGGTAVITESGANAISETGGGGIIVLSQANTAIVSGQLVSLNSYSLTMPA